MEGKEEIINTKIFKQENIISRKSVEILLEENTDVLLDIENREKTNDKINIITAADEKYICRESGGNAYINVKDTDKNEDLVNKLIQKMSDIVQVCGAKLIIAYHPRTVLNEDGSLSLMNDSKEICDFSRLCKDNGVYFLDMSNRYIEEYTKNYIIPNGFNNTSIGSGHMNKYGHAMMADELYKLIEGEE